MLYTFFDVETRGFSRTHDGMICFSYLTVDEKFAEIKSADILYMCKEDQKESCNEALEVHGITLDFLKDYRDCFDDNLQKIFKICTKGILVGQNITGFDIPYMQEYMALNGYGMIQPYQIHDTLKMLTPVLGKRKLGEYVQLLGIPEFLIKNLQDIYFKDRVFRKAAHDASYDVVMTYLVYLEARRRGYF